MDIKTEEKQKRIHIIISLLAVLIIAIQAGLSWKLFWEPVQKLFSGNSGLVETAETITSNYISDLLPGKNWYITINGLFARLTGRRRYNKVTLMTNGMLSGDTDIANNWQSQATNTNLLVDFSSSLQEAGIHFLYIQTPVKEPLTETLLPGGLHDAENAEADDIIKRLNKAGVNTLDLRPLLSATREDVEKNFYCTDHHWNADGAILAYQKIIEEIASITGRDFDLSSTQEAYWQRHEKENWWLGSRGKRVGPLYAGTDSLIWYTPVEKQEISCIIPSSNKLLYGGFSDACIREKYITSRDLFELSNYGVYIGTNYRMVNLRNRLAPNPYRILLLGDSFSLPIKAFMSTAFTEVDSIDPRHYTTSTIAEYISWTNPDFVIIVRHIPTEESIWGDEKHQIKEISWETVLQYDEIAMEASRKRNNVKKIDMILEPGKTYRVSFDDVVITEGDTKGVSLLLYDKWEKKVYWSTLLDIDYCQDQHEFSWVFFVPKGEGNERYELRLCAGLYEKTYGIGVTYKGMVVSVENQKE